MYQSKIHLHLRKKKSCLHNHDISCIMSFPDTFLFSSLLFHTSEQRWWCWFCSNLRGCLSILSTTKCRVCCGFSSWPGWGESSDAYHSFPSQMLNFYQVLFKGLFKYDFMLLYLSCDQWHNWLSNLKPTSHS